MRPFSGETPAELLRSHLFNPPLPFSESDPENRISPELRAVILKAIEKKREDRFATAEDFDREISSLKDRLSPTPEPDDTRAMLARVPETEFASGGVTPSVQDRLDHEFAGRTPRPSRDLTLVPTDRRPPEHANVARMVAEKAGSLEAEVTAAAPSLPARPAAPPVRPSVPSAPPKAARRAAALWIVAIGLVAVAATIFLTRPRAAPTVAANPIPERPTSAPAAVPLAESPAPQTVLAPEPTVVPTAEPAVPTAARATVPAPAPADPRVRQALRQPARRPPRRDRLPSGCTVLDSRRRRTTAGARWRRTEPF